jgi:hypothetical protein
MCTVSEKNQTLLGNDLSSSVCALSFYRFPRAKLNEISNHLAMVNGLLAAKSIEGKKTPLLLYSQRAMRGSWWHTGKRLWVTLNQVVKLFTLDCAATLLTRFSAH